MRRFGAQCNTQSQLGCAIRSEQVPGLGAKCNDLSGDSLPYMNRRQEKETPPPAQFSIKS
jgi:hypothetical protein